jgi:glutamate racemase
MIRVGLYLKIGVFDSGLGGLTIVNSLLKKFNNVQIFYVADTAAAPYGEKLHAEILEHSLQVTQYLIDQHNIDALVVACNTATSAAIKVLREKFSGIIIVGTEPGVKPAIETSQTGKIGVLATVATLQGEKYSSLVNELSLNNSVQFYEQGCPGLVDHIELGDLDSKEMNQLLKNWLEPMKSDQVDTIVLGCTHYPIVSNNIKNIMGEEINLIETGYAIANRLQNLSKEEKFDQFEKTEVFIYSTGNHLNKRLVDKILNHWVNGGKIDIR